MTQAIEHLRQGGLFHFGRSLAIDSNPITSGRRIGCKRASFGAGKRRDLLKVINLDRTSHELYYLFMDKLAARSTWRRIKIPVRKSLLGLVLTLAIGGCAPAKEDEFAKKMDKARAEANVALKSAAAMREESEKLDKQIKEMEARAAQERNTAESASAHVNASVQVDILKADPLSIFITNTKTLDVDRVIAISPDSKFVATARYDFTNTPRKSNMVVDLVEANPASKAPPKHIFTTNIVYAASWNASGTKLMINHLSPPVGPNNTEQKGFAIIDLSSGKTINIPCDFQLNNNRMCWASDMSVVYITDRGSHERIDLSTLRSEPISPEEFQKWSRPSLLHFVFKRGLDGSDSRPNATFIARAGYLMSVLFSKLHVTDVAPNGAFVLLSKDTYGNGPIIATLNADPNSARVNWPKEAKIKNSNNVALSGVVFERLLEKAIPAKDSNGYFDWNKAIEVRFYRPNINPLNDAILSADMSQYIGRGYVYGENRQGVFDVYIFECLQEIKANDVGLVQIPVGFPERTSDPTRRGMLVQ